VQKHTPIDDNGRVQFLDKIVLVPVSVPGPIVGAGTAGPSRKPEEIGRRGRRALTHAVAHSQAVSIVDGHLIGSAFATAPVVCLTLAKWETMSGQFGGYLNS
jgi:hypothetical protein